MDVYFKLGLLCVILNLLVIFNLINVTGVSVSNCLWTATPKGEMFCNVAYGLTNKSNLSHHNDTLTSSSAACQWQNTTSIRKLTSIWKKVIVYCNYEPINGVPILDAGIFKTMMTIEDIDIRNTPLKKTLPSDTFCHLPMLSDIALRHVKLDDLDDVGLGFGQFNDKGVCYSSCGNNNLKALWLSSNQIKTIKKQGPLCGLTQLDTLGMDENSLEGIHPDAFINAVNLEYIFMNNNSLTRLSRGTFKTQRKLQGLDLSRNKLNTIEAGTFDGLDNLSELFLDNNELNNLQRDIFIGLSNLLHLELSHNDIVHIPDHTFVFLKSLENLFINDNKIRELASIRSFKDIKNLKYLRISNNFITTIDMDTMAMLPMLTRIDMDNNKLTGFSSQTFKQQTKLEHLQMNDNLIRQIDNDTFGTTNNMKFLYLGGNQLSTIPDLRQLKKLQDLNVSSNSIETIVSNSLDLISPTLLKLNLSGNRLQMLPDFLFKRLTLLTDLYLSKNEITQIGNDTFTGMHNLKYLYLDNNKLNLTQNIYMTVVTPNINKEVIDVFNNAPKLITINLSGNAISSFKYHWFPNNVQLLDLSRNQITNIESPIITTARASMLTNLDLSHNAIETIKSASFPFRLQKLSIDYNLLSNLTDDAFVLLPYLKLVSLQYNRITTFNKLNVYLSKMINVGDKSVQFKIKGNPLVCDCHLSWIQTHNNGPTFEIDDFSLLTCRPGFNIINNSLSVQMRSLDDEYFLCSFDQSPMNMISRACLLAGSEHWHRYCIYFCPQECRCYHNAVWNWIILDCSSNNLVRVPSEMLIKLTVLNLDSNNLDQLHNDDFAWLTSLRQLYVSHNIIETITETSFLSLTALENLHLNNNALKQLSSDDLFVNMKSLVTLDLSYNKLSYLSENIFAPLVSLQSLKLNDNQLVDYAVWTLDILPSLLDISLQMNPWSCECDYAWSYRNWISNFTGKLNNKQFLYCYKDGELYASLITFNVSDCYVEGGGALPVVFMSVSYNKVWLASIPTIVIIITVLFFIYRREMQVLIYWRYGMRLFHKSNEQYDADKLYDAFVSYSSLDEEFVVNEFLPHLEGIENPYSLCLHHRDFPIGAFINESIFDSVAKSRRTILILSQNFVRSEWCRFEFRTAHSQMMMDRCNRVIVIIYGEMPDELDTEMKLYLRTNTYLVWGDRIFWKKLYFALPERQPRQQQ